jgi:hypothetical protein
MLPTHITTHEPGPQLKSAGVPAFVHLPPEGVEGRHRRKSETAIDDALAASFPASDPPGWNPGLARPVPADRLRSHGSESDITAANRATARGGVIEIARPKRSEQTLFQALISFAAAAGIVLLVPFAILLVGLPVALAIRGLLELFLLFNAIR